MAEKLAVVPESLDLLLQATSFVHGEHELPYLAVLDLMMHIQPNRI